MDELDAYAERIREASSQAVDRGVDQVTAASVTPIADRYEVGSRRLSLVNMGNVQSKSLKWLWPNVIPEGKVTLCVGYPGVGKSALRDFITATVTTGGVWPDGSRATRGSVLYLTFAEDDLEDTTKPRLVAAGADCDQVVSIQGLDDPHHPTLGIDISRDLDLVMDQVAFMHDCRLVVVDPINAYIDGTVDQNNVGAIRSVMTKLKLLSESVNTTVLAITHPRKGAGKAIEAAVGSGQFTAAARAVWFVAKDPHDESTRLLLPIKSNLGPDAGGFRFHIEVSEGEFPAPYVVFDGAERSVTADELLDQQVDKGSALAEAIAWLEDRLDADGKVPAKDATKLASEAGISSSTLRRAKDRLGVISEKQAFSGEWVWRRPTEDAHEDDQGE